jgi:hypothetical protein
VKWQNIIRPQATNSNHVSISEAPLRRRRLLRLLLYLFGCVRIPLVIVQIVQL